MNNREEIIKDLIIFLKSNDFEEFEDGFFLKLTTQNNYDVKIYYIKETKEFILNQRSDKIYLGLLTTQQILNLIFAFKKL